MIKSWIILFKTAIFQVKLFKWDFFIQGPLFICCIQVVVWSPSHVWLFHDPMDCGPPGSSVHGISQAKILEWVAISSSRAPSWLREWAHISSISCTGRSCIKSVFPKYLLFLRWKVLCILNYFLDLLVDFHSGQSSNSIFKRDWMHLIQLYYHDIHHLLNIVS